jgi:hypothetical protein
MRKTSLIVTGFVLLSFSVYLTINYLTTMEDIRAMVERHGTNAHFEQGLLNGKIATGVLMLIGISALAAGLKKKKVVG